VRQDSIRGKVVIGDAGQLNVTAWQC
jgi:hypothetical protein